MEKNLIPVETLCSHYEIEFSFINSLYQTGLIELTFIEEMHFIEEEHVADIEKMIRLHSELNINIEGIDVVFNLLEKEKQLREELTSLKRRLRLYEND